MEKIRIDIVPGGVTPVAHASQNDVGRSISFNLFSGVSEYTLTGSEAINISMRRPDGTLRTQGLTNTMSNYVVFTTVDGDLTVGGVYSCELTIYKGDAILGSRNFVLKVEPDAYDGTNVVVMDCGPADICTFETNLADALVSLKASILASGGGGTPSTPIPIVGISSLDITANGTTFTIDLGGTRYGGYVDAVRGKFTDNAKKFTYTDIINNYSSYDGTLNRYRADMKTTNNSIDGGDGSIVNPSKAKCNIADCSLTWNQMAQNVAYPNKVGVYKNGAWNYTRVYIYIDDASVTTKEQAETWLENHNFELVYELATPIEIDVSAISVNAVSGVNNVFCNSGETELKYLKIEG